MPQLRWTLLLLGVLFVILLWWLERRNQRAKFRDRGPIEKEPTVELSPGLAAGRAPAFREPSLTLPEMRARESGAPHELPVVEIEDDSLNARRMQAGEPLMDPPTLSLPVMESGPERRPSVRRERVEPSVSGTEWIKPPLQELAVPRLDTPAPKRPVPRGDVIAAPVNRIELADTTDPEIPDTEEQAFNDAVFGDAASLDLGESTSPDVSPDAPIIARTAASQPGRRAGSDAMWATPLEPTPRETPEMVQPAAPEAARHAALGAEWNVAPTTVASPAPEGMRTPTLDTAAAVRPFQAPAPTAPPSPQPPEPAVAASLEALQPARAPDADAAIPAPDADAGAASDEQEPSAPRFTAADVTPIAEPIVDWPPDDQRRVVALRLVAPPPERLAGRALRLALASEGFVLGKFQIFHKPDANGRAVLSAANLSKPGTFDLGAMDVQRFGGLSLFAVLPGPKPALKTFDELLATARSLNERLQGALQDERGGPLTPTRIASMRETLAGTEAAS